MLMKKSVGQHDGNIAPAFWGMNYILQVLAAHLCCWMEACGLVRTKSSETVGYKQNQASGIKIWMGDVVCCSSVLLICLFL
jgi:hypothetical protein